MSVQPLINLYGLDREQLEQLFKEQGLQAFRGRQLMKWVYHQGRTDFMAMTDLPLRMRAHCGEDGLRWFVLLSKLFSEFSKSSKY